MEPAKIKEECAAQRRISLISHILIISTNALPVYVWNLPFEQDRGRGDVLCLFGDPMEGF